MCSTGNWTQTNLVKGTMLQTTEPFVCSNYKNKDTLITTVCWVCDGTKLKEMFCHNKDFNKLNLYLFTNQRCRVREGVQGYSDSPMILFKKQSYVLYTMIPYVCFLSTWSRNSRCTSKHSNISSIQEDWEELKGHYWRVWKGIFFMCL